MKIAVLIASTLCVCLAGNAQAAAELYTIEPAHTYPSFEVSLPLFESIELLGRDMTVRRLQYAQEALAASGVKLGGEHLKRLEREYTQKYAGEAG